MLLKRIMRWIKLIIKNPLKIFELISIVLKFVYVYATKRKYIYVTNDWERFDPDLTIWRLDKSHLPRYTFATNFIKSSDILLDVACWTWYWTEILSKYSQKAYWVDISKDAILYAKDKRKWKNLQFIQNDLYDNAIKADVVVSFETIEHIPDKKIEDTIEKLLSYSKKIVIGSYPYKERVWNNHHHYQFDLDESNLDRFRSSDCNVKIYYQDIDWKINDVKPIKKHIQNLIFILHKIDV